MNLQNKYIIKLNKIIPDIDYTRLDQSCNSTDNEYAKTILKQLHDAFVDVYETDYLDQGEYEFVELPAVIRGRNTDHIALGIVSLDLESSGEHWGTLFLTPKGVLQQGGENLSEQAKAYINKTFIPYDYWYTVELENDIHIDFENIPEKVADILKTCSLDRPEISEEDFDMKFD